MNMKEPVLRILVLSVIVLMAFPATALADMLIHYVGPNMAMSSTIIWNCGPPLASTEVWLIPVDGKTYVDDGENCWWLGYDPTGESKWLGEIVSQDPWGNDLPTNGIKFTATWGMGKPDPDDPYFGFRSSDKFGNPVTHEMAMKAYYFDDAGNYHISARVTAIDYTGPLPSGERDGEWMVTVYSLALENLEPAPTMTQWGLIALGVLLAASLAWMIRGRFRTKLAGA